MARPQKTKAQQTPPPTELGGVAPSTASTSTHPTHGEIAERAYQIWLARGAEHGRHHDDWAQAEQELRTGRQ